MNQDTRITLADNTLTTITKMCDGNLGAMNVLIQMLTPEAESIDPDNILGGLGKILSLDSLGIYGTDIYILHNDICDRDLVKMFAVLRAWQLGFINGNILANACAKQDGSGKSMVDVDGLYKRVQERLPNFK